MSTTVAPTLRYDGAARGRPELRQRERGGGTGAGPPAGVLAVEANAAAQTATVTFDPPGPRSELRAGSRSAATTAPGSPCPATSGPVAEPRRTGRTTSGDERADEATATATADTPACRWRRWSATCATASWSRWFHDPDRRLVDGRHEAAGHRLATPFGIDRDVWQFLLSLPIVLYASSIFFAGAVARSAPGRST